MNPRRGRDLRVAALVILRPAISAGRILTVMTSTPRFVGPRLAASLLAIITAGAATGLAAPEPSLVDAVKSAAN